MTRHPQEVQQSYNKHMAGERVRLTQGKTTIELNPEGNADGEDSDGFPDWEHHLGLFCGHTYLTGRVSRSGLVLLHSMLTSYLHVEAAPVRVVVTIDHRRTKKTKPRKKHDAERAEREAIKKEMRR